MDSQQIFTVALSGIALAAALAIVPIVGYFWTQARAAEQNAVLKKSMIDRGFSADEIVRVIESNGTATSVWDHEKAVALANRMVRMQYPADDIAKVMRHPAAAPADVR